MKKQLTALTLSSFLAFSVMAAPDEDSDLINVNQATAEELDKGLLGVGPRIAMEIVKYRDQHGPFQSMEDLDKVKYVGNRMLNKNKERISFD